MNPFVWSLFRGLVTEFVPGGSVLSTLLDSLKEGKDRAALEALLQDFEEQLRLYGQQHGEELKELHQRLSQQGKRVDRNSGDIKDLHRLLRALREDWLRRNEYVDVRLLELQVQQSTQWNLKLREALAKELPALRQELLQELEEREKKQQWLQKQGELTSESWGRQWQKSRGSKGADERARLSFPSLPPTLWHTGEQREDKIPLFWQMVWQLSGLTLVSPSLADPLHGCPWPVYTAVLSSLRTVASGLLDVPALEVVRLTHGEGLYRLYNKRMLSLLQPGSELLREAGVGEERMESVPLLSILLQLEEKGTLSSLLSSDAIQLLLRFRQRFQSAQALFLERLQTACVRKERRLTFVEQEPGDSASVLALLDVVRLVECCARLFPEIAPANLPELTFRVQMTSPDNPVRAWTDPLHHYLAASPLRAENLQFPSTPEEASPYLRETPEETKVQIVLEKLSRTPTARAFLVPGDEELVSRAERLRSRRFHFPASLPSYQPSREVLDSFARRFFPLAELRQEQVSVLNRLLPSGDGVEKDSTPPSHLAVLPTGYGKSLIYQLFGLLVPRLTLVVSPLKSLIRDQVTSLHNLGFHAVVASLDSSSSRMERAQVESRLGSFRLLYISPERLLIQSFRDTLKRFLENGSQLGALVVDEAHCVSEWGHDFRPSYLQLSRIFRGLSAFSRQQSKGKAHPMPLLALTATAPRLVREDICQVLDIPAEHVEQRASSDRLNFSFSVHPVRYEALGRKQEELRRLLVKTLPRTLGHTAESFWSPDASSAGRFQNAGMIFGMYLRGRERRRYQENLHIILDNAVQSLQNALPRVDWPEVTALHGSTNPQQCRHCGSLNVSKNYGRFQCQNCHHEGTEENRLLRDVEGWEEQIRENQDRYKKDELALMVATKSFGMGIDKPNVRFVVHHSLSSSISAYYQEAGRAGRDGQHAHVSLLYQTPCQSCREDLRGEREPACLRQETRKRGWCCPYFEDRNNPGLCDYGLQAGMIASSFGDTEVLLQGMRRILEGLRRGETTFSVFDNTEGSGRLSEILFYRLQQMGILQEYRTSYEYQGRNSFRKFCHPTLRPDLRTETALPVLLQTLRGFESHHLADRLELSLEGQSLEQYLEVGGRALLEELSQVLPQRRYEMLYNQLEFAESQHCRRVSLRATFDGEEGLTEEEYRCGFCDRCRPDLRFEQQQARPPSLNFDARTFGRHITSLLESGNLLPLTESSVLEEIQRLQLTSSLRLRAQHTLELDSTNLAAYYLAGQLRSQEQQQTREAMLLRGMDEAIRQSKPLKEIGLFALALSPSDETRWGILFDEEKSPWSSVEGLQELADWLVEREGDSSPRVMHLRQLAAVRSVQGLPELSGRVQSLTHSFKELLK